MSEMENILSRVSQESKFALSNKENLLSVTILILFSAAYFIYAYKRKTHLSRTIQVV